MVAVPKKNGSVRICVDLRPLNTSVMRETHPLPKVEVFQKRMSWILQGLEGVLCLIDDVLVFGRTEAEHSSRLHAALQRIQSAGVTLNVNKCSFFLKCIKFLGHIVDQQGVSANPDKVSAVTQMAPPQNITEVRRFLGMVNQLAKFSPLVSEMTHPLRQLLSMKTDWTWNPMLEEAFLNIKTALSKPTVLTAYNIAAELKVSADASSHSLGAALLQRQSSSHWQPVCYASRSMTSAEVNYAQIEKEALALTWACERFRDYVLGKSILIETDHKPLVSLLGAKPLDDLTPRILRFRLRLSRFDYIIHHVPGKKLHTADVLSRTVFIPNKDQTHGNDDDDHDDDDVDLFISSVVASLLASSDTLARYSEAQSIDHTCSQHISYCQNEWPTKHSINTTLRPYWEARHKLSVVNGLLLYNQRIVVPLSLQKETISKIHSRHLGIQKCLLRARNSLVSLAKLKLQSPIARNVHNTPLQTENH